MFFLNVLWFLFRIFLAHKKAARLEIKILNNVPRYSILIKTEDWIFSAKDLSIKKKSLVFFSIWKIVQIFHGMLFWIYFIIVNANIMYVHIHVVVTVMTDDDRGNAWSGIYLICDRSGFVARHETMCVHVFLLELFLPLISFWGVQVADIKFFQTNQATALKMLKSKNLVLLAWNVYIVCM